MALSNWDIMAWDTEGKSCVGFLEKNGVRIEIYKNWVYIYDKEYLSGDKSNLLKDYNRPVMTLYKGFFDYKGFKIHAVRNESQNGIYIAVSHTDWDEVDDEGKNGKKTYFFGIGCYGYSDDNDDWIGVTPETFEEFIEWIGRLPCEDFSSMYCQDEKYKRIVDNIKQNPYRYNQGDAFFAVEIGFDNNEITCENSEINLLF